MNRLLVISVLVALLALNAESFRVPRQADEQRGTVTRITDAIKYYYGSVVNTASDYIEDVKGMKLEEKAKNLYDETVQALSTYYGIAQDQAYHIFSS